MFETSFTATDFKFMLEGAGITLKLTCWAMLLGTAAGALFGLLRATLPRLSMPLGWLLDVFRSVPLLIQFVLFNSAKSIVNLDWSAFEVGALVLAIYTAAYCTEIVRSGILAVPTNVIRAARSLGMNYTQTLLYITLPMATRVAFSGWINLALGVMKDTSLVMWIGIIELLRAAKDIITRIQEPLLVLCIAGAMYYVMSWGVAALSAKVEKRWSEHD